MKLYHYTDLGHLGEILETKIIKTTASNLLRPVKPHIKNGCLVDITDNYKPVVWLTTVDSFEAAKLCGLIGSTVDKTEVAIVIDNPLLVCHKWETWAIKNHIDNNWFNALKETAPFWRSFYVCEKPIPITEDVGIIFRPDIMEALKK